MFGRSSALSLSKAANAGLSVSSQTLRRLFSGEKERLDITFRRAVATIQDPVTPETAKSPSSSDKLRLYALYKQAEHGPCSVSRPGVFDPVGRAKFDAWHALGQLSDLEAKKQYVELVTSLVGTLKESVSGEAEAVPSQAVPVPSLEDILHPPAAAAPTFSHLLVEVSQDGVAEVVLNRPTKGNAFNVQMWGEVGEAVQSLSRRADVRVILLRGAKGNFSTGMDVKVFSDLLKLSAKESCDGRRREALRRFIAFLQEAVTALEECPLPVISAVHGHCIGGAIDLICAADLRYATEKAAFSVKEIDLAIVADMGTLQRLPRIIGQQRSAELALTARTFSGREAAAYGLVLETFPTEEDLLAHARQVAREIASKSPLTVRGVKQALLYARDHTVRDSLDQVKLWNSALLQSEDLTEAASAMMEKRKPFFPRP
eukprot:gene11662-13077_t